MVLPGAVLFPGTMMPLYIFEERYRAMLARALDSERMFCIALMKPGVTEAETTDEFHHISGLGLVRACVGRDDGTSHLILQGLGRVRFTGFEQAAPFRIASLQALPDEQGDSESTDQLRTKVLRLCARMHKKGVAVPEEFEAQLDKIPNAGQLTDVVAHTYLSDSFQKQELLEEPNIETRMELLVRHLTAALK